MNDENQETPIADKNAPFKGMLYVDIFPDKEKREKPLAVTFVIGQFESQPQGTTFEHLPEYVQSRLLMVDKVEKQKLMHEDGERTLVYKTFSGWADSDEEEKDRERRYYFYELATRSVYRWREEIERHEQKDSYRRRPRNAQEWVHGIRD